MHSFVLLPLLNPLLSYPECVDGAGIPEESAVLLQVVSLCPPVALRYFP